MRLSEVVLFAGFTGIGATLLLALLWAPSVSINAFESPAAQRIFYWHVPAAWAAFIAFGAPLWVQLVGYSSDLNGCGASTSPAPKPG